MSGFTDLTVNDGQTTPVAQVFKARVLQGGVATWWNERSNVPSLGWPSFSLQLAFPAKPDGIYSTTLKVRNPIVDAPAAGVGYTPAPKLAYFHELELKVKTNGRGTRLEKQDLLAYLRGVVNSARFAEYVLDQDAAR